jgi:hypothetical protein
MVFADPPRLPSNEEMRLQGEDAELGTAGKWFFRALDQLETM